MNERIDRLEHRIMVLGIVWAATLLVFTFWWGRALITSKSGEVRARSLIIVDQNGIERIHLGSPLPGPRVQGRLYERRNPQTGITINDSEGNERAGFGVFDDGTVSLGIDSERAERVSLLYLPTGIAGLLVTDDEGNQRSALGILSPDGASGLVVNDGAGAIRASVKADRQGDASVRVNDPSMNAVFIAPTP